MNQLLIDGFVEDNDKVELIFQHGKVKWVDCINHYPLNTPIAEINKLEFGKISYCEDKIIVTQRIDNGEKKERK